MITDLCKTSNTRISLLLKQVTWDPPAGSTDSAHIYIVLNACHIKLFLWTAFVISIH